MTRNGWNHNIHYYDFVARSVPAGCQRALDVGCGEGQLARLLARTCGEVIAIDIDADCLAHAREVGGPDGMIQYLQGDVMTYPFPGQSFDFITVVATLHHLDLGSALARFRDLLRPGGVLAVVGLYRLSTAADYVAAGIGLHASWACRCFYRFAEVTAPTRTPTETLGEIRGVRRNAPGIGVSATDFLPLLCDLA